jgi:hypothetical protein
MSHTQNETNLKVPLHCVSHVTTNGPVTDFNVNCTADIQHSSHSLSVVKKAVMLSITQVFSSFFVPGCYSLSVMSYIGVCSLKHQF